MGWLSASRLVVGAGPLPACLEVDQPQAHGLRDGLGAALGTQITEDRVDMELDGVVADVQVEGDGLVGEEMWEREME